MAIAGEGEIARRIRQFHRDRFCELSAWVSLTKENVSCCFTCSLTAEIYLKNCAYLVVPRHFDRRAVVEHYYNVFLHLADFVNQFVLAVGHTHMLSVIAFRFKAVGKPCEYYRYIAVCGKLYSLFKKSGVCVVRFALIALCIRDFGVLCGAFKCV